MLKLVDPLWVNGLNWGEFGDRLGDILYLIYDPVIIVGDGSNFDST